MVLISGGFSLSYSSVCDLHGVAPMAEVIWVSNRLLLKFQMIFMLYTAKIFLVLVSISLWLVDKHCFTQFQNLCIIVKHEHLLSCRVFLWERVCM